MRSNGLDLRRARVWLGGIVVAVSLAAAGALGGVGLAQTSVTAAQDQYGKIVICHHTHSKKNPQVTLAIDQSAWKAHQKHGDTLGACATTTTTSSTTATTTGTTTAASPGQSGLPHGNSGGNGKGNGHG